MAYVHLEPQRIHGVALGACDAIGFAQQGVDVGERLAGLRGDIAVLTIDNPPVNALSAGVPEGIVAAVRKAEGDPIKKGDVILEMNRKALTNADEAVAAVGGARVDRARFYEIVAALVPRVGSP